MTDEKKKMTAQGSSVGADDGQSISQNYKTTIPDPDEKSNSPERVLEELYQKMRRMSDPAYLHTVTLDELMDNVFEGKSAVIENLLYTGAYILAGAPKIGKSFLVAQIAHHVSTGQDLWGYKVHQGTVLYLALEDDESRLQRRMFRMFGVEGTSSLHFATNAKMIGGVIMVAMHTIMFQGGLAAFSGESSLCSGRFEVIPLCGRTFTPPAVLLSGIFAAFPESAGLPGRTHIVGSRLP